MWTPDMEPPIGPLIQDPQDLKSRYNDFNLVITTLKVVITTLKVIITTFNLVITTLNLVITTLISL